MHLTIRRIVGFFSRLMSPGYGSCYRCGRTWNIIRKPHYTRYSERQSCFPLCEACRQSMTIQQRVNAHWRLYLNWQKYSEQDIDKWHAIERAVREGK